MVINEVLMLKIMDSIVEIIAFVLSLYCTYHMIRKYRENRQKAPLYLSIMFTVFAVSPIMQFFDGLFYVGHDFNLGLWDVQYGYATIVIATAAANISLLFFASEVFWVREKIVGIKVKTIRTVGTVLFILTGMIGGFLKYRNLPVTHIIAVYMFLAMMMYIYLAFQARKLASYVTEIRYKKALLSIADFSIILLGVYIFFILDSFYTTYSIWGFFGWATYLVAVYEGYKGFVEPQKIKKTAEHEKREIKVDYETDTA